MRIGFGNSIWTGSWMRSFPPASSTSEARRGIFRLALDIVQTPARQVVYIENTPMFVQVAEGLGLEAFFTRITGPPARAWLRSDWALAPRRVSTRYALVRAPQRTTREPKG